jgi:multiple sugar transport system permease protein
VTVTNAELQSELTGHAEQSRPVVGEPTRRRLPFSRPRRTLLARKEARVAYGFLSFNLAGFALFTLIPVIYSLYLSFFNWPLTGPGRRYIGIHNYSAALASFGFWQVVLNVLYFVGVYVPLNFVISLGLAVLLGPRSKIIKGKAFLRVVFFLPVVTPVVASSLVWGLMYNQGGVINAVLGAFGIGQVNWLGSTSFAMPSIIIMSLWLGFGYNMILYIAGMTNIPEDLYEAAALDGAGPIRQLFSVTLPMLSPFIFFGTLLTLITSFQIFTRAYILTTGGPGNASTTLVLEIYDEAFKYFRLGYASAIAWLLFILILVVTGTFYKLQGRWVYYEQ